MSPSAIFTGSELRDSQSNVPEKMHQDSGQSTSGDPYYSYDSDSQTQAKLRERFKKVDLRTNEGGRIENIGWLKPSVFRGTPIGELRRRLKSDGYLYLRRFLPSSTLLSVREEYFELFRETGILDEDYTAEEGIFKTSNDPLKFTGIGGDLDENQKLWKRKIRESHTMPMYLKFVEHEELRKAVRLLMDWKEEILLERTMIRSNVPGGLSTATHYDKLYLRQGSDPFLTGWVPIGMSLSSGSTGTELMLKHRRLQGGRRWSDFSRSEVISLP